MIKRKDFKKMKDELDTLSSEELRGVLKVCRQKLFELRLKSTHEHIVNFCSEKLALKKSIQRVFSLLNKKLYGY